MILGQLYVLFQHLAFFLAMSVAKALNRIPGDCLSLLHVESHLTASPNALLGEKAGVRYIYEAMRKFLITLTDGEGVVLDVVSDDEIHDMKNFPHQGAVHNEKVIGTNGIRTSLFIDGPVQIQAEEHWLRDNRSWSCNSSTIHRSGKIVGCLNLSCPFDKSHEHSQGLIVASANAMERELELSASLPEKQGPFEQQNTGRSLWMRESS
jgi:transcriptional regulator of acetoin/glycerol metabolism